MFGSIGFPELVLIFVVVLLVFGPKKLPEFAKLLGRAVREFRTTVDSAKAAIEDEIYKEGMSDSMKGISRDVKEALNIGNDLGREVKDALDVGGRARSELKDALDVYGGIVDEAAPKAEKKDDEKKG
ncbi:MAG: twin-arginine translocase TatA/TatE family subunit [Acidobacteria bacterium]|jgi:TatA/E family protein of Tat protein translocase|nr:twin-arginine translocase TatA/TatE family subunit [Acidobacteriota bacterium]